MRPNPKAYVEVLSPTDLREKTVSVQVDYTMEPGPFVLMLEVSGDVEVIACSTSARALVRWAFDRGALKVRSDYDLRHER